MSTRIEVNAEKPYEVTVGRGVAQGLSTAMTGCDRVAILHPSVLAGRADELADAFTDEVGADVTLVEVPTGEKAKTSAVLDGCWRMLAEQGFTRSDGIVGFGGGATTDLAGFVAATWLRGVRYVSVPTTLLAMVDAAVGGKTGINLPDGKNLVGAFWEPAAVFCDLSFLDTLPRDDLRGGLAEMIKHGFIADARTLELFEADPDAMLDPGSQSLAEAVERSIRVKASVVAADLREKTSSGDQIGREALNYGHTLAHAIERREHFGWRHGYAVSIGMQFAATLAQQLGLLTASDVDRHRAILTAVGLPVVYDGDAWSELRTAMSLDKKTRGADLRFVLLDGIGRPRIVRAPAEDDLAEAYTKLGR